MKLGEALHEGGRVRPVAQDCAGFQAADLDRAGGSTRKGEEQQGRAGGDLKDLREGGYCAAHLGDQAAMSELAAFGRPVPGV